MTHCSKVLSGSKALSVHLPIISQTVRYCFLCGNGLAKGAVAVMVPDASVTAYKVPDTSLLVIQVITKRGAVNLADILISQYISPDRVLIRIQFAYRHGHNCSRPFPRPVSPRSACPYGLRHRKSLPYVYFRKRHTCTVLPFRPSSLYGHRCMTGGTAAPRPT